MGYALKMKRLTRVGDEAVRLYFFAYILKGSVFMCFYQGKAVGEYCPCCQNCTLYLSVCSPAVSYGGFVSAECDFSFCCYCPFYSECSELWGGGEFYETA